MRDYRRRSKALQARFRRVHRRVPGIRRELAVPRVVIQQHTSIGLNVALTAHHSEANTSHHRQRLLVVTRGRPSEVSLVVQGQPAVTTVLSRLLERHTVRSARSGGVVSGVATNVVRSEARVRIVERVVAQPLSAGGPQTGTTTSPPPPEPQAWVSTPRPAHVTSTATPDIAAITNHVMRAIDQRLVAYNERLGRG